MILVAILVYELLFEVLVFGFGFLWRAAAGRVQDGGWGSHPQHLSTPLFPNTAQPPILIPFSRRGRLDRFCIGIYRLF